MPLRKLVRALFLLFAAWGLVAGREWSRRPAEPPPAPHPTVPDPQVTTSYSEARRRWPRVAASAVFVTLFFAGAAFSAGAGDKIGTLLEETNPGLVTTEATTTEAAATIADTTADATTDSVDVAPHYTAPAAAEPAPAPAPALPAVPAAQAVRHVQATHAAPVPVRPAAPPRLDPEASAPGSLSVVWLNEQLPDPTPPAVRLAHDFAHRLTAEARRAHVGWALLLGVLRAEGAGGAVPARESTLRRVARRLAAERGKSDWAAALAVTGRTTLADEAAALARYDRAVGLGALVLGLEAARSRLVARVLADPRVQVYDGGREDLADERVDVRVVALIEYLADTFHEVTVSSLISGHRLFARPGVVSAHVYGHAVDVSSLGGVSIEGHQQPGGLTERAVRQILLLPGELRPRQVISLLGLGGPSFPLPDHYDHIHVGY